VGEIVRPKHYIVDGLNVCHWHRGRPSLAPLLTLAIELVKRRCSLTCIFDASTSAEWLEGASLSAYRTLLASYPDDFVEVSGGSRADEFILLRADTCGGCVISNDHFRKYERDFGWIRSTPSRLIKGKVIAGNLLVPDLTIDIPIKGRVPDLAADLASALAGTAPRRDIRRNQDSDRQGSFGFAILYGNRNGYWYENIPDDAADKLEELNNEGPQWAPQIRPVVVTPKPAS
jgi:hypothetical protein